jgi:hypothetical protein
MKVDMTDKRRRGFLGTLVCLFGLHRWEIVGYNSILNPLPVERCARCGIGRQFHVVGAEFRFTREQMEESCKPNAAPQTRRDIDVV